MKQELAEKVITVKGCRYVIGELMRRIYAVEESSDGVLWEEITRHDNSEDAKTSLFVVRSGGAQGRIVVVEVTDKPKKCFWDLWRTGPGRKALKSAGVFVHKVGDEFLVTDTPVTKRDVLTAKGFNYGGYRGYEPTEFDKHAMIDRDADRYGW